MSISIKLLLADYEKARATGDSSRANSIFKQMEKIGLPDHLKPKPKRKTTSTRANSKTPQNKPSGIKLDPGRF